MPTSGCSSGVVRVEVDGRRVDTLPLEISVATLKLITYS